MTSTINLAFSSEQWTKPVKAWIGSSLRDILFFPLNGSKAFSDITKTESEAIFNPKIIDYTRPEKPSVLQQFTFEKKMIKVRIGNVDYHLNIMMIKSKNAHSFHTTVRVGGNDETFQGGNYRIYSLLKEFCQLRQTQTITYALQLINFSFYGHEVVDGTLRHTWRPQTAQEIGIVFFNLLAELKKKSNIAPDTLICHSLGSVVLAALPTLNDLSYIPKTLVLDRAMPSVKKVGDKLYHWVPAFLLFQAASWTGWSADPEGCLVKFSEKRSQLQKVILVEVPSDFYFSEKGGFSSTLSEALKKHHVSLVRHNYSVNELFAHPRAHHALLLEYVTRTTAKGEISSATRDILKSL